MVNRPASQPSHQGAAGWIDRAIDQVEKCFETVWLRGDTDFSLTKHFDGWDQRGMLFVFGYDAHANLVEQARDPIVDQSLKLYPIIPLNTKKNPTISYNINEPNSLI